MARLVDGIDAVLQQQVGRNEELEMDGGLEGEKGGYK